MVFFLDDYILASYFLWFFEMWSFSNKWVGKPPWEFAYF